MSKSLAKTQGPLPKPKAAKSKYDIAHNVQVQAYVQAMKGWEPNKKLLTSSWNTGDAFNLLDPYIMPKTTKAPHDTTNEGSGSTPVPGGPSYSRSKLASLCGFPHIDTRRVANGVWREEIVSQKPVTTQKAKGLELLYNGDIHTPFGLKEPEVLAILPRDAWKFRETRGEYNIPAPVAKKLTERWPWNANYELRAELFARPCPLTPRHGFVESRVVKSDDDIFNTWLETRAQDQYGELILMPVLTGKYSGVAHNAGVAYGLSNDGVTGGAGSVFIPAPSTPGKVMAHVLGTSMGNPYSSYDHGIKTAPYLELVENKNEIVLVQLRDGPEQTPAVDFVPRAENVTKLLEVPTLVLHGKIIQDLLAWEKIVVNEVRANGGPQGLVVNLPGSSLASHAAVHAIQAGVSVITSRTVGVGETLTPLPDAAPALTPADYLRLRDFVAHYAKPRTEAPARYMSAMTAAGVVHVSSLWGGDEHLLALRALGITELIRLFTAAGAGEDRHWYESGPGRDYSSFVEGPLSKAQAAPLGALCLKYVPKFSPHHDGMGRDKVYTAAFALPWEELYDFNLRVRRDFHTSGWKVRSSFGGLKWGRVADAAVRMITALETFAEAPGEATWAVVMMEANKALSLAHNSGKLLTKWVESSTLDAIALCPLRAFLNPCAAECALFAHASHNANHQILLPASRTKSNEPQAQTSEPDESGIYANGYSRTYQWSRVSDAEVLADDRTKGQYWEEDREGDEPVEQRDSRSDARADARYLRKLQQRRDLAKLKRANRKNGTGLAAPKPDFDDTIPF